MRKFVHILTLVLILGGAFWVEQWVNKDQPSASGSLPTGKVRAIDGDSFHMGDGEIRLYAIDAPEARQNCQDAKGKIYPCGKEAADALNAMLKEDGLKCEETARDRYGRTVARCSTLTTADVGEAMVHQGWAVALTFTKKSEYADVERRASAAGRGIWQGEFMRPSDWRNRPADRI